ncbi:MAG: hypothetical protein Kow00129_16190 [Thermoleophilia bacterium]
MLPEDKQSELSRRWRAVRYLAVAGTLVYAGTLGFLVLALTDGADGTNGRGLFLVLLVAAATMLAAAAVYGAYYRRLPWIWTPGVLLLLLAIPWASFWPFLVGAALVGLAAALARPEQPPSPPNRDFDG